MIRTHPLLPGCLAIVAFVSAAQAAPLSLVTSRQDLDFDRPESWGMKYVASETLMTGLGPPRALRLGQVRVGAELAWLPAVTDAQRTIGFNGTKEEDLNKLPAIGRLRVSVGLGWKLSLTLSYLPPIEINDVRPNLFSFSLGRPLTLRHDFTLGLLAYGQVGSAKGDFTCPDSAVRAGADPVKNPVGCIEKSRDKIDLDYGGLEVSASYRIVPAHRLEPYVAVGANYMNLRFHVHARYGTTLDTTELATSGFTASFMTGALFPVTRRLDLVAEAFYSPLTVERPQNRSTTVEGLFNVRGMIAYRFF